MVNELALVSSAALMGLAGAPHCTAMCGAACAAAVNRCAPASAAGGWAALLGGRLVGYAAAGAAAALAVSSLAALAAAAPALRTLWTVFHLAALALGLWLLVAARLPAWLESLGRGAGAGALPAGTAVVQGPRPHAIGGPLRSAAAGLAWVALPCGLLHSALLTAALADRPLAGAATMAAFALTSTGGLALVPALGRGARRLAPATALRLAGAGIAAASAWALGHGLWERIAAYCGF